MARGQRIAKSGGRPRANWPRREAKVTNVSWPGPQAGGATISQSGPRGLTQNRTTARRPTALLRGRILRLPWRIASGSRQPSKAPNVGNGKESVANSHSRFRPRRTARFGGDVCFPGGRCRGGASRAGRIGANRYGFSSLPRGEVEYSRVVCGKDRLARPQPLKQKATPTRAAMKSWSRAQKW